MSGHRGAKYPAVPGTRFLPVNRRDMDDRGWDELDFLLVTGDAYVDHPSFGAAVISRVLEAGGYRVGILPQPDWRSKDSFMSMGRPRHAVLITAGNLDSMLNKLTASKKSRSTDVYSPGGRAGMRPDRATIVYSSRVRECWRDVPIVIGGVEASLRRFAHYDYWSDEVRRSILYDSQADLLVYGMGELQVRAVADGLAGGTPVGSHRESARSMTGDRGLRGRVCTVVRGGLARQAIVRRGVRHPGRRAGPLPREAGGPAARHGVGGAEPALAPSV